MGKEFTRVEIATPSNQTQRQGHNGDHDGQKQLYMHGMAVWDGTKGSNK